MFKKGQQSKRRISAIIDHAHTCRSRQIDTVTYRSVNNSETLAAVLLCIMKRHKYINKSYLTRCIDSDGNSEFLVSQAKNLIQDTVRGVNIFALKFFFSKTSLLKNFGVIQINEALRIKFLDISSTKYIKS